ncbi:hypothetical protein B0A52_00134 [Exophiala mesophila]|uniref:Nicotinamide riboside kinase n=1 Tax=Exophiala mesophila TaxID=212818 RepID=A0A438NJ74_EXOME|nr:hypothetical protein B0A52_00134 [Exophiala mesophila]
MATTKAESPSTTTLPPLTILLGLSGPSSSGKTTLARLLRTIFHVDRTTGPDSSRPSLSLFIIHQDDFYLTDTLVPVRRISSQEFGTRDLQDWDCVESLDLKLFEDTLCHVQAHGVVPEGSVSKEDENSVGESGVSDEAVEQHGAQIREWFQGLTSGLSDVDTLRDVRICVLDGFLLYPRPPSPPPPGLSSSPTSTSTPSSEDPLSQLHRLTSTLLSPRLFLPTTLPRLLHRRLNRTGYVTLEGFWTDPPGYCQDLVWPNYVRDHAWMYVGGDVNGGEGVFDQKVLAQEGITVCPGAGAWPMSQVLDWAVEKVWAEVERRIKEERGSRGTTGH